MIPYIVMFCVPAALALLAPHSRNTIMMAFVFVFYVVMIGLREKVGVDWPNYITIHDAIGGMDFWEYVDTNEPFSKTLFWLSSNLGDGVYTSNIFSAIILMSGVVALMRRVDEPWLALAAVTPHLCIVCGMAALRQVIAVGIFFLVLAYWRKLGVVGRVLLIGIASLFHSSALALLVFVFGAMRGGLIQRLIVTGGMFAIGVYLLNRQEFAASLDAYGNIYLSTGEEQIISPGALAQLLNVVAPAILFFLFRRELTGQKEVHPTLLLGSLLSLAMVPAAIYFSTAAARFSYFLQYVPLLTYSAISSRLATGSRAMFRIAVLTMSLSYLVLWLFFANNSRAYVPYQSILFQ